jgi:hypothetical protein
MISSSCCSCPSGFERFGDVFCFLVGGSLKPCPAYGTCTRGGGVTRFKDTPRSN